MKLPGPPIPQVHLQPGELLVTETPQWVITLLGSCLSVTMFNARFHLAAICHAMLSRPRRTVPPCSSPAQRFRYLSDAIPAMARRFSQLGMQPHEVEVKLFGGGDIIELGGDPHRNPSIGQANIVTAHQLLNAAGFQINTENVGGDRGRKIVFNTESGEVLLKRLSRSRTKP
jgi:chemotaxis protein CheD